MKKRKKEADSPTSASPDFLQDPQIIELQRLAAQVKEKYQLSTADIARAIDTKDIFLPVSAFTTQLSALETIVKFLRENVRLSYKDAAQVLGRSEKTIWQSYAVASRKHPKPLVITAAQYYVPLSLLLARKLSVLETIVVFLKETYGLSYHEIAVLIHRNDRTVWTVYQRALRKKTQGGGTS